jgi:flagellar basal body L-ring protein FlgH
VKKVLAIVLSLILAIAFTMTIGCKKAEEKKPAEAPAPAQPAQPAQPEQAPAQPAPAQPGK